MKGKSLIKTIPDFAAAPSSISDFPGQDKKQMRHYIALGGDACALVIRHGNEMNFDTYTLINDCEFDSFEFPVKFCECLKNVDRFTLLFSIYFGHIPE